MTGLLLALFAAAGFACVGETAENRKQYLLTGCCVAGVVMSLVAAGVQAVILLAKSGWQP